MEVFMNFYGKVEYKKKTYINLPNLDSYFYFFLNEIIKNWNFSILKLSKILKLDHEIIENWFNSKAVKLFELNDVEKRKALIKLIIIYKKLSKMFSDSHNQKLWLETYHPELKDIPINKIEYSYDGINEIKQYLDYICERGA